MQSQARHLLDTDFAALVISGSLSRWLAAHWGWQQPPPLSEAEQKGWSTAPVQRRRWVISHLESPNHNAKGSTLSPGEAPCEGEKGRKENLPWTPKLIIRLLGRRQHISFGKSLVTQKNPLYHVGWWLSEAWPNSINSFHQNKWRLFF